MIVRFVEQTDDGYKELFYDNNYTARFCLCKMLRMWIQSVVSINSCDFFVYDVKAQVVKSKPGHNLMMFTYYTTKYYGT